MLDAARRQEYAKLINDSGQHLLSVVNGILDMSKIETGNFEISPEPFAPRAAMVQLLRSVGAEGARKRHRSCDRAPEDLPEIIADKRAFKQILLNLCRTRSSSPSAAAASRSARDRGTRLMLRVEDTGVGIGARICSGSATRSSRPAAYDRRHDGTGLGLSIVKGLVALHGGEMNVQPVGEGTTVTVSLPLKKAKPTLASAATSPRST